MISRSIYGEFRKACRRYSSVTAVSEGEEKICYSDLQKSVDDLAERLAGLGIGAKSRVTVRLNQSASQIRIFYALNAVGAVICMIHPSVTDATEYMRETGSDVLVSEDEKGSFVITPEGKYYTEELSRVSPKKIKGRNRRGVSVCLMSGGTSSAPKTVCLTDGNFNALSAGIRKLFGRDELCGRKALFALPVYHGFGLCLNMHTFLTMGITLYPVKSFGSYLADFITENGIEILCGVPALYNIMLREIGRGSRDLSFLKLCFVGGDRAGKLVDRFNDLVSSCNSDAKLCEGYGLTECSSVCSLNLPGRYRAGSVGIPLPGVRIKIFSEKNLSRASKYGEIRVKGRTVMQGYLDVRRHRGWLKTGDLGYIDDEGFLHFVERRKRMVKINGANVFPSETESAITEIDGVENAVVVTETDDEKGAGLTAYVVASEDITPDIIKAALKKRLEKWSVPESIIMVDRIPETAIGKKDFLTPGKRD